LNREELVGLVCRPVGRDRHLAAGRSERARGLAGADHGAGAARHIELGFDAGLWPHEAAFGLEVDRVVVGEPERREARPGGAAVEHLVRYAVLLRRPDGCAEKVRVLVVRGARAAARDHRHTVLGQNVAAGRLLELAPDFVRAARELSVHRALTAGEPGNARFPVARAEGVRRREAVDAEHGFPRSGELPGGGRSHGAQSEHDRIEHSWLRHSRSPFLAEA